MERKARLFYWEAAMDAWVLAPEKVEQIVSTDSFIGEEVIQIAFKRMMFTDEELEKLPEA